MIRGLAAIALVIGLGAAANVAAAPHDEDAGPGHPVYKIGQAGEVKIADPLTIGSLVLPKGRYLVQHRVDGTRHLIVLTRVDPKAERTIQEFVTQLIAEKKVAKRSAIFADDMPDGSERLSAIQIAGEAGDHIVESAND